VLTNRYEFHEPSNKPSAAVPMSPPDPHQPTSATPSKPEKTEAVDPPKSASQPIVSLAGGVRIGDGSGGGALDLASLGLDLNTIAIVDSDAHGSQKQQPLNSKPQVSPMKQQKQQQVGPQASPVKQLSQSNQQQQQQQQQQIKTPVSPLKQQPFGSQLSPLKQPLQPNQQQQQQAARSQLSPLKLGQQPQQPALVKHASDNPPLATPRGDIKSQQNEPKQASKSPLAQPRSPAFPAPFFSKDAEVKQMPTSPAGPKFPRPAGPAAADAGTARVLDFVNTVEKANKRAVSEAEQQHQGLKDDAARDVKGKEAGVAHGGESSNTDSVAVGDKSGNSMSIEVVAARDLPVTEGDASLLETYCAVSLLTAGNSMDYRRYRECPCLSACPHSPRSWLQSRRWT
jgi:hypothetical protein